MEVKFILTLVVYAIAIIAYVKAYILNITTPKQDILVSGCLVVALLTGCFRLFFYVLREREKARMTNIKNNEEIRDILYNRKMKERNMGGGKNGMNDDLHRNVT